MEYDLLIYDGFVQCFFVMTYDKDITRNREEVLYYLLLLEQIYA